MDDALPLMRDRLREHPEETGLWAWLCVIRATDQAVGSAGFTGLPDAERLVTLGYAIYPEFAGRGYASEAAALLAAWALGLPGVEGIRATVPVGHGASLRVAAAAGLSPVGTAHDREAGEVVVLERRSSHP